MCSPGHHFQRAAGGTARALRQRRLAVAPMCVALALTSAGAQQPPSPSYRGPSIALVQPPAGATVPRDKPVVVFRFMRGETADLIDAGSFTVTVDGVDRSTNFQVTADEAWGPLGPTGGDSALAVGPHKVAARICSVRGACAHVADSVSVVDPSNELPDDGSRGRDSTERSRSLLARLTHLLLDILRALIAP